MTQDELDLLASAYLDGEATPDEVALVERDPALQALVAEMRAVDLGVGVPPAPPTPLKEAHLGAARQAFEQEMTVRREGAKAVAAAAASRETGGDHVGSQPATPWWRTMPSWLPVAAVLLVVGGGLAATLNQAGGNESASETAEVAVNAMDDSATEDSDSTAADSADAATFGDESDANASQVFESAPTAEPELDRTELDAESGLAAEDAADLEADADEADEAAEEEMAEGISEAAAVVLAEIPTSLDSLTLPELNDPMDSTCFDVVAEEPVVLEGFVEAILDQEPVELWVVQQTNDAEAKPMVVNADCLVVLP